MFKVYETGFQVTFRNGFTVSVQWASHNYSQPGESAEVRITDAENFMYVVQNGELWDDHEVMCYQTPEAIAEIMSVVSKQSD